MDELYKTLLSSLYDENCLEKQYSKIYKIHKYWARKPWFIVEKYIKEHSKINDVVMDPFCGSGVTGAEAIVNGRNFIGQDLNPMSILVTQGTLLNNINFEDLKEDFKKIQDACQNKIQSLNYVDSFTPLAVTMTDGCKIPLSRKKQPIFKERFHNLIRGTIK